MEDLSSRQREILEFLSARVDQTGVLPSYREIGAALGIRSTNGVSDHVKALLRKGYLERVGSHGASRSMRLTRKATGTLDDGTIVGVPILGQIAAGALRYAEENYCGTLRVDAGLFPGNGNIFALVVTGDSMIDDGIHDGDYLFVREQKNIRNGDIGVVLVDDEATVKRVYREEGRLRLQPSNQHMDPIYVDPAGVDIEMVGVAVGVFRGIA
jgi:repressor LexA